MNMHLTSKKLLSLVGITIVGASSYALASKEALATITKEYQCLSYVKIPMDNNTATKFSPNICAGCQVNASCKVS